MKLFECTKEWSITRAQQFQHDTRNWARYCGSGYLLARVFCVRENKNSIVSLFFSINPIVLMRSLRENYSRIEKKMFPMTIWRAKSIYFLSLIRNERFTEFAVRVFHDGYWEITEKVWKTDYTSIKQIVMLENPIYIEVFTGMKYWWKSVHVTDG